MRPCAKTHERSAGRSRKKNTETKNKDDRTGAPDRNGRIRPQRSATIGRAAGSRSKKHSGSGQNRNPENETGRQASAAHDRGRRLSLSSHRRSGPRRKSPTARFCGHGLRTEIVPRSPRSSRPPSGKHGSPDFHRHPETCTRENEEAKNRPKPVPKTPFPPESSGPESLSLGLRGKIILRPQPFSRISA